MTRHRGPLDLGVFERLDRDLGEHFEDGGIAQLAAGLGLDRLDAWTAGRAQPLLGDRLGESALHELGNRLGVHLTSELLLDHGIRDLSGTKALDARRASQPLESLVDLSGQALARYSDLEASLETMSRGHGYLHCAVHWLFHRVRVAGAKGETRTLTGCPTGF